MENNNIELTKQQLIDLNQKIAEMEQKISEINQKMGNTEQKISELEQKQKEEALEFFASLLSDQFIFRRASGTVVGKSEKDGFLDGLKKPGPFTSRVSEDFSVSLLNDRALVTLFVVGTKSDGTVGRYRNIRMFSRFGKGWVLEFWYNYEVTSL